MDEMVGKLIEKARELEEQIEIQFKKKRDAFPYHFEKKRIVFDPDFEKRLRAHKISAWSYFRKPKVLVILTMPFIYGVFLPLVLLDLFVTIYQAICFPVYGIEKVRRGEYVVYDRQHLAYLNWIEKLNCMYCSYANGLIAYVREIAARTEQYWCPIKHARRISGAHGRYHQFSDYGDGDHYHANLQQLRAKLKKK